MSCVGLMSFGPLGTLGAGRTAGGLIVGIYAEPSLDHRYTVMSSVFTVLIYTEKEGYNLNHPVERKNTHTHTFEGTAGDGVAGALMHRFGVQIAGCVVLFVCSETPHLPRLHPFTAGPRALDRYRRESVTAEEERTDGWRDEVVLTVLHSVVNHCGLQGCSSHGCTGDGLSRCVSTRWQCSR